MAFQQDLPAAHSPNMAAEQIFSTYELIESIFNHLQLEDLLPSLRVNRTIYAVIKQPVSVQSRFCWMTAVDEETTKMYWPLKRYINFSSSTRALQKCDFHTTGFYFSSQVGLLVEYQEKMKVPFDEFDTVIKDSAGCEEASWRRLRIIRSEEVDVPRVVVSLLSGEGLQCRSRETEMDVKATLGELYDALCEMSFTAE